MHDTLIFFMEVFVMVFLSLINSACSLAERILLILIFFVGFFLFLFLYFTSVHEHEQDDEEKRSK